MCGIFVNYYNYLCRKKIRRDLLPPLNLFTTYPKTSRKKDFGIAKRFFVNPLLRLFADIGKYAAVYIEYMAVDCVGRVGGKEYCGACKLVRF